MYDKYEILKDVLNLSQKNNDKSFLTINLDYSSAFDSLTTDYLTSYLSYIGFPSNIIKYIQKLSIRQFAIIKNIMSDPIPIQSGVSQGLSCSGDLFFLAILPIYLSINNSQIIRPYQISSKAICQRIPENFCTFKKCLGFSDDLIILTEFDLDQNENCPQLDFVLDLHNSFQTWSGLALNNKKC